MAAHDIMPWNSGGQSEDRRSFPVGASETFLVGEPVVLSSGAVTEASDDPASILGIAAHGAADMPWSGNTSFATGRAITVYGISDTQRFICSNFATDGAGTSATPTQANAIGQLGGLTLSGSTWSIDTGTANLILQIEDVLDSQRNSIQNPIVSTGTGASVIFRFL